MLTRSLIFLSYIVSVVGWIFSNQDDDEDYENEPTEVEEVKKPVEFWKEPHYYMRPHMYVQASRTGMNAPLRQEILESTFTIVKLDGGYGLPDDLRNRRIQLDLGKDTPTSMRSQDDKTNSKMIVNVSNSIQHIVDSDGTNWTCHLPDVHLQEITQTEVQQLIVDADVFMRQDIGRNCWISSSEPIGLEFCWNKSLITYDYVNGRRQEKITRGVMPNKTHRYYLVPDPSFSDPLALTTQYNNGKVCNVRNPLADGNLTWTTDLWFHCNKHTPRLPKDSLWYYSIDESSCKWRVDIWASSVCRATIPLLHRNRNYILCRKGENVLDASETSKTAKKKKKKKKKNEEDEDGPLLSLPSEG